MEINPSALVFKNQSVKGTLVAGLAKLMRLWTLLEEVCVFKTMPKADLLLILTQGLLKLEPTVVGLSQFNESVQKLRNGQVAGYVSSPVLKSN